MIVNQIHVMRVSIDESKRDAPVSAHRDRPDALPIAFQFVQVVSGKRQVRRAGRRIEHRQYVRGATRREGSTSRALSISNICFKPLWRKLAITASIVT